MPNNPFEQAYVMTQMCQKTHEDYEKLCKEKHHTIDIRMQILTDNLQSIGSWVKGLVAAVITEVIIIGIYIAMGIKHAF